jgi:hypothetical protein
VRAQPESCLHGERRCLHGRNETPKNKPRSRHPKDTNVPGRIIDPEDAAEFLDEEQIAELPDAQWFDPAAALPAVRALTEYIRSHADAVPGQALVLADMAGIEAEGADAERAGGRSVPFRRCAVT